MQDSILVSYDDIRAANAKMVELKYEKEVNKRLKDIVNNDSIIIDGYRNNIRVIENNYKKDIKQVKKQRNVAIGTTITSVILLIISLL